MRAGDIRLSVATHARGPAGLVHGECARAVDSMLSPSIPCSVQFDVENELLALVETTIRIGMTLICHGFPSLPVQLPATISHALFGFSLSHALF
jgi:hypothetical protein